MAILKGEAAAVPLGSRLLLLCSAAGSLLFTATYLIEGTTRPGYGAWQQAISALSLGPGGWVQRANFAVFGLLLICSAVGWRRALRPGLGDTWFPILKATTGIALIGDAIFSQDPAPGYPPGAVLAAPTLPGTLHTIFAVVSITALAAGCFVLARRFAREPSWRGWGAYSVITGLLIIVLISMFGSQVGHGGMAGLLERLATGVEMPWSLLIIARLWAGSWRLSTS